MMYKAVGKIGIGIDEDLWGWTSDTWMQERCCKGYYVKSKIDVMSLSSWFLLISSFDSIFAVALPSVLL